MKYRAIREQCLWLNREIVRAGLVLLTWGNAGVADRAEGVFAIKPSGVDYDDLTSESMVIVSIETGKVVEGSLRPSSDTPTYVELFRAFADVNAIVHTHSHYAVCFAQAHKSVPLLGTTHADFFRGPVPVTRLLNAAEIDAGYEAATGRVIAETLREAGVAPLEVPAVLVAAHGPFAWGNSARHALESAVVLEEVARMALHTRMLNPGVTAAPSALSEKHFTRKHGAGAYYGQPKS